MLAMLALGVVMVWGHGATVKAATPAAQPRANVAQLAAPAAAQVLPVPTDLGLQGQHQYQAGDYEAAISTWHQAAAQARATGDTLALVRHLNNLSLAQQQLGQWDAAAAALGQSKAQLDTLPPTAPTTLAALAQTWSAYGALYRHRAQPTQAAAAFASAAEIYEFLQDADGTLRSRINQARALQTAGYNRDATALLEALSPPLDRREPTTLVAAGLITLGSLNRNVGYFEAARTYLHQGLAMAQQLGDVDTQAQAQLALGSAAEADGKLPEALVFYRQVADGGANPTLRTQGVLSAVGLQLTTAAGGQPTLEVATEALEQLPPGRVRTYGRIHLVERLLDTSGAAAADLVVAQLQLAEVEALALGDRRALSYIQGHRGQLYQQQNQPAQALKLTEAALQLATSAPDISYLWNAQLAEIKRQQGDKAGAIANYTAAVATLQTLRTDLVSVNSDLEFNFGATVEPIYRNLVDLLTDAQDQAPSPEALLQARDVVESLQVAELENFFREACLAVSKTSTRWLITPISQRRCCIPFCCRMPTVWR